jgi:hypothetical protein
MKNDLTPDEQLEVFKTAISILIKKIETHEMKLNLLAQNIIAMQDKNLQMLNSPN